MSRGAVVLVSGGIDSAVTLALAVREAPPAHAMTVRYGQRHVQEVERAAEIARRLGAASQRTVDLDLGFLRGSALTDPAVEVPRGRGFDAIGVGVPVTYVPGRNTLFLALALAWAESLGADSLWIGANAVDYSGYPDCRPEFLEAFAGAANLGTRHGTEGGRVEVRAPLLHRTKAEIVRLAVDLGVPVHLTLSCYAPKADGRPCGECDACAIRARGFREAGLADPAAADGA